MRGDVRLALKGLWKNRGYAATAILTLAVCLGANAAIFTIVYSVLLKPLPVPDADRIVLMANRYPNAGTGGAMTTNSGAPDYYDRLRDMTVYDEQAMYNAANFAFDIDGAPELVRGMAVTPSFFRLVQVPPHRGRIFDEREGEVGNEQAIVLSYGLWQQLTGGAEDAIGRPLRVGGRPFTLVGVMPPGFQFAEPAARFWIPIAFTPQQKSDDARHGNNWWNIARLKPGATVEQAQTQVDAINRANMDRFPMWRELLTNAGFHTRVERLQDVLVRSVESTLYFLWGGALFVLLIGGLNIANLALARSTLRAKELSTRMALGASRGRVALQLVTEGVLVALAGAAGGMLTSLAMLRALYAIGLERIPRAGEIQMDLTVALALLGVSLTAGVLIGLMPLVHLPRVNLSRILQEETRSGSGGRRTRAVRRALVVAEVAFACLLLIGSGLLVASFRNLVNVDAGFRTRGVITANIGIPRVRYPEDADVRTFVRRVFEQIRTVPGVEQAGGTTMIPLGDNRSDSVILAEGYRMQPGESLVSPYRVTATPGYFEAMGTPLVRGRTFTDADDETRPGVVIVDERLARKFWGTTDPIGRRMYNPSNPRDLLATDANTRWVTVIGVVREVRLQDLTGGDGSAGAYYFPAAQVPTRFLTLAIKATNPQAVLPTVRARLQALDPAMPLAEVRAMEEYTTRALMPRRAAMLLATSFGLVSLFLAAIGIYGVLAYLVTQRSREIGIRMALGSTSRGIVELVLREGVILLGSGVALGLGGAFLLRGVLVTQVFGLSALDPGVIALAVLILGLIALFACSLPARRASKVDPVAVLSP